MNITSVLRLTFWHSTNSGAQHYPKHSPNTSGTRVEKFGKELSWKQTLSRWIKKDASEFHNVKLNAKEVISTKLVTIPKTGDGQIKIYWRRSGSENSTLDKVSSKFEEKFKKTLLENQTGFHQPPKQEVIAHQHKRHTEISDILTKIASKNIWENLSWTSSTSRLTPSITGKTSCYNGTGFIDVFLVKLVYSNTSDIINAGCWRFDTPASIECESEDRQARGDLLRNPTNQAMSMQESQRTSWKFMTSTGRPVT